MAFQPISDPAQPRLLLRALACCSTSATTFVIAALAVPAPMASFLFFLACRLLLP
jgi:hypothetical protein